jgi:PAS domain S-box-containing protein
MAELIATFDWSTSLGPPASWPQSLKTFVGFMMRSPIALVLLWGEDGIMIYNDAYSRFAGRRHPRLLGSKVREGWPEVADFNDNVMKVGLAGGTLSYKNRMLMLDRSGALEPAWLDLEYSAVPDESGRPGGVVAIVVEITERVQAEARRDALVNLTEVLRDSEDPAHIQYEASRILGEVLRTHRVGYGTIDPVAETLTVGRDWTAPGIETLAGTLPLRAYGSFIDDLKRGEFVAIADVDKDARTRAAADALKGRRASAFVNEPILERGKLVAVLFVNNATARQWTNDELVLVREVAARIRGATERLHAARTVRANEARLRFLDQLGKEAASSLDADTILATTTRMVGEYLDVSICAYADMDDDGDGFTIRGDWCAPGHASIVGRYRLSDFGTRAVERLSGGRPLIVNDALAELASSEAAILRSMGVSATICMPLVKDGRLTALMAIHDEAPRRWSAQELALMAEVTERSWAHIERVRSEEVLRTSEAQFRVLAQAMPNHVWTSPPGGELDWFNDQVYAYSGFKPGDLDGSRWSAMVHPEDLPLATARWAEALSSGKEYQTEFRLRRYDGAWRWHLARAIALRGADGTIVRWVGTNTDVDDQKNAEARLEARLEQRTAERDRIWQVSQDILVVADSHGVWQSVNPAATRILGWTESELLGRTSEWMEHPDDIKTSRAEVERIADGGKATINFVNRFRTRDGGYRTLSWSAVTAGGLLYGMARDITEQQAQAAALAQAEDQLRQSQKMEAVGQLTGGIAHDFNNLLQGITGALDRVQHRMSTGRGGDVERFLKAAIEAANRAAGLTHRLLAFSRRQTLDPRPTDVNRLISGMEDLIRRTMGPTIVVEVIGAGGLWPAKIDAPQLESALLNLCINARDAMPDGGNLTVETANKWLDERAARERDLSPGQYISVCVTDTGTGMTPDVVARAFDPFFTTKPLGQGTGLGLSMIYGFVRQSGGQVRIYSEVGRGTTMCIYFPRFVGPADEIVQIQEETVERGFGESVLVVDDDATVRMLVAEVLTEQRYHILEAADGPSAIRIVESGARIDLMITDVGLPGGMNGRQVADAARLLRKGLKVLFITGYAENAAIGNGHLDQGMAILTKPFAMSTLGNKVREMLEA